MRSTAPAMNPHRLCDLAIEAYAQRELHMQDQITALETEVRGYREVLSVALDSLRRVTLALDHLRGQQRKARSDLRTPCSGQGRAA